MAKRPSIVANCFMAPRNDDVMFEQCEDGTFRVELDGYAIVPLEHYLAYVRQVAGFLASLERSPAETLH